MAISARRQMMVWIVMFGVLALLFGMWTRHNLPSDDNKPLILASATLLPQARPINNFQLTDEDGKPFTNDNLKNHWSLVFFGFTHCPYICPTTLSTLNQAYKDLQLASLQPMPQVVFISVDPERDTTQQIKNYLVSFNTNFIGATGSKKQLDELTKQFNVTYAKVFPGGVQGHYTIDHSGTVLLVDPNGELYGIFSTPHNAQNISKDLLSIINNYSSQTHA